MGNGGKHRQRRKLEKNKLAGNKNGKIGSSAHRLKRTSKRGWETQTLKVISASSKNMLDNAVMVTACSEFKESTCHAANLLA